MRASHDQNSAITCPVLKEKEKRRESNYTTPARIPRRSLEPIKKNLPRPPENRFFALADEEEETEKTLSRVSEFPLLPTIRVTVSHIENSPAKRTYASVAVPLKSTESNLTTSLHEDDALEMCKTPVKKAQEPVAPYAPMKSHRRGNVPATFPKMASIKSYCGRWADNYSSDEDDGDE